MNKKNLKFLAIIAIETVLLFIMFVAYMHMKNLVQESIEINQELIDSYARHNELFHCNLEYNIE